MTTPAFVLIVDDEKEICAAIGETLQHANHHVRAANNFHQARQALENAKFDIAILDVRLPDGNGIELLSELRTIDPEMGIIMISGYAEVDMALEAVRLGADDFLKKPFDMSELVVRVEEVLKKRHLKQDYGKLAAKEMARQSKGSLVGQCPPIKKIHDLIELLGDSDSTVLITGETGTGKEVVAKTLHASGSRSKKPFVSINCGAIPEELLESELFGHVKGAFTGAVRSRSGRFENANGGTIFLDEIGDMTAKLQVKLLRVLQERCFEPVGSDQSIEIDVRVIAATHQNLEALIEEGSFREDLYYRLNIIPVHMPPLRERDDDILLLSEFFIDKFNGIKGSAIEGMNEQVKKILLAYAWPGNVREMQNLFERIATLKRQGVITKADLPDKILRSEERIERELSVDLPEEDAIDLKGMVEEYENQLILSALQRFDGNKTKAANFLSMNRTTLVEKIKNKGLNQG